MCGLSCVWQCTVDLCSFRFPLCVFQKRAYEMLHLTADRIRMRTHQKRRRKNAHTSTPSTTLQTNPTNTHCTERASARGRPRGRPRAPQRNIDVFACQHTIFPCAKAESNFERRARQPYVNEILVQYTEYKIYRTHAAAH